MEIRIFQVLVDVQDPNQRNYIAVTNTEYWKTLNSERSAMGASLVRDQRRVTHLIGEVTLPNISGL